MTNWSNGSMGFDFNELLGPPYSFVGDEDWQSDEFPSMQNLSDSSAVVPVAQDSKISYSLHSDVWKEIMASTTQANNDNIIESAITETQLPESVNFGTRTVFYFGNDSEAPIPIVGQGPEFEEWFEVPGPPTNFPSPMPSNPSLSTEIVMDKTLPTLDWNFVKFVGEGNGQTYNMEPKNMTCAIEPKNENYQKFVGPPKSPDWTAAFEGGSFQNSCLETLEEEEEEDTILPIHTDSAEPTWFESNAGRKMLPKLFQNCATDLMQNNWKPYTVHQLPLPIAYRNTSPGTMGVCHVVRVSSPSDFHVIFVGYRIINHLLKNKEWLCFFNKNDIKKRNFNNSGQLYTGMQDLLTEFARFVKKSPDLKPAGGFQFSVGDLVIIDFDEDEDDNDPDPDESMALRGLITSICSVRMAPTNNFETRYRLYLLDTGEHMFAFGKTALVPLPKAFTGFPPMAVRCSLGDVLPQGQGWSDDAKKAMENLVTPESGKKIFAKFLLRRSVLGAAMESINSHRPCTSTTCRINDVVQANPFSVELKFLKESAPSHLPVAESLGNAVSISAELCSRGFASRQHDQSSIETAPVEEGPAMKKHKV